MLLIVLLGLIAKLALVSCDCDLGPVTVNDIDWSKFADSRPWYWLLHTHEEFWDSYDCTASTFADPVGNSSAVITVVYDRSLQRRVTFTGNVTNLNNTGLFELQYTNPMLNGRFTILAIDYDRYFICKYCAERINNPIIGVAFRSSELHNVTLDNVKTHLEENSIDITQLPVRTRDRCQLAESSTEGGSSA